MPLRKLHLIRKWDLPESAHHLIPPRSAATTEETLSSSTQHEDECLEVLPDKTLSGLFFGAPLDSSPSRATGDRLKQGASRRSVMVTPWSMHRLKSPRDITLPHALLATNDELHHIYKGFESSGPSILLSLYDSWYYTSYKCMPARPSYKSLKYAK
ncbi:hypothetical protein SODALDRAFT_358280 [Sodiomyces alkalinus F11]|uniref:Uncharacterized protein n=1 Tax=Sodiomyces alkalinus (strain CBS 110278 / VKM F-3762 / F11) TaxID=1314773 RepID=A0A3N2PZK8_SODAK|nr:hypothetical protein SODALDRAFT_358280 [Sodiomyces alkalinus F11]ROT39868.1 hypothetical protein SODALDRAFT_358280 [Sodiomyces alkalinus F11]